MEIKHNFVPVGEAVDKLKDVDFSFPGPAEAVICPAVGDYIDLHGLESYMFVVVSRRFCYKPEAIDIVYVVELASHVDSSPDLSIVE